MTHIALGALAGGLAAFLWFFVLYGVWLIVPIESPPAPVEFITKWFPLTVALPSLLIAGVVAALVAREAWVFASVLCGSLIVLLLGWFTQATGVVWVLLALVVVGVGLTLLGGYLTRLVAKHA
jgi:hypothetical protein